MESYYSDDSKRISAKTVIRYGQEVGVKDVWKKICEIDDELERRKRIDELLEIMEENSEENGFICRNEPVDIGGGSATTNCFKIDDNELYYMFFENIMKLRKNYPDMEDHKLIYNSVINTVTVYFGGLGCNLIKRDELTMPIIDDDDIVFPSISNQRGMNCSACTEKASISHNLWLLCGVKSYYVCSNEFAGNNMHFNPLEGHSFGIVYILDKYRLFDLSLQIFKGLNGDPIEEMLAGKPFEVETKNGEKYLYANAKNKIYKC